MRSSTNRDYEREELDQVASLGEEEGKHDLSDLSELLAPQEALLTRSHLRELGLERRAVERGTRLRVARSLAIG